LPAVQAAREAARRMSCTNNLKQIAVAMHNYHQANGSFPPAYFPDENGNPAHSWRVILLPYMEQKALYDYYDFDSPWNSPENQAVADAAIPFYGCPSDSRRSPFETNYMMIVGPGMLSDGPGSTTMRDISDGTSNTIMIVEVSGTGVHWAEPRDLDAGRLDFTIGREGGLAIGSRHPGCANVALCDGSVVTLAESTDPQIIRAMATIAGGEVASPY
jgi:prepilin-type processing-associated H-X9-DG protein